MITVTGLEASGTRALRSLVSEMTNEEVRHLSWPHGTWEWGPDEVIGSKVIVIVRRLDIRGLSAVNYGHTDSIEEAERENLDGMKVLASIPDALWISYEAMVANQDVQIKSIAKFIGVEPPESHIEWVDGNEKWMRRLDMLKTS